MKVGEVKIHLSDPIRFGAVYLLFAISWGGYYDIE